MFLGWRDRRRAPELDAFISVCRRLAASTG
jgi:hypothetical protein